MRSHLKHLLVSTLLLVAAGCTTPSNQPDASTPPFDAGVVTPAVYSVSSVGITGSYPQLRQGAGVVPLSITGQGLGQFTAATLSAPFSATLLPGGTADRQTVNIIVPHAAPIGPQNLTLGAPDASIVINGAFAVTAITASPSGNNGNSGSSTAPFATLSFALGVAQAGDTVHLQSGTYGLNETWPSEQSAPWPPVTTLGNVPDGVSIVGDGFATTELLGPGLNSLGADAGLDAGNGLVGLVLQGSANLSDFSVESFERDVITTSGTVSLNNVHIGQALLDGFVIAGTAQATVSGDSRFHESTWSGVGMAQTGQFSGANTLIDHNLRSGAYAQDQTTFRCTGCEFGFNGGADNGDRNTAIFATDNGTVVALTGGSIHDTSGIALIARQVNATLEGVTISNTSAAPRDGGNAYGWAIYEDYSAFLALNNCLVTDTAEYQVINYDSTLNTYNTSFFDAGFYGIYVSTSGSGPFAVVNMYSGTIAHSTGDGVRCDAPAGDITLNAVTIVDSLAAVSAHAGTMTVLNSTLDQNRAEAVFAFNNSSVQLTNDILNADGGAPSACIIDGRSDDAGSVVGINNTICNGVLFPPQTIAGPYSNPPTLVINGMNLDHFY